MDPRLLDVLHDGAYEHISAVADGVHVDLHGVLQEVVYEHGMLAADPHRFAHVDLQAGLIVDYLHGSAAQDVRRPHQDRIADPGCDRLGLIRGEGDACVGLGYVQLLHQQLNLSRSSARSMLSRRGAEDASIQAHAGDLLLQRYGQVYGRLAAELHQHSVGPLLLDDVHDVL